MYFVLVMGAHGGTLYLSLDGDGPCDSLRPLPTRVGVGVEVEVAGAHNLAFHTDKRERAYTASQYM